MAGNLNITTSVNLATILALLFSLAAFTLYIYRRTNPIVSAYLKWTLAILRFTALLLAALIIFETTLEIRQTETMPPALAVAIDNSASMNIKDINGHRLDQVKEILNNVSTLLRNRFSLQYYIFDNKTKSLTFADLDSLQLAGDASNITGCLEHIKGELSENNLNGILLITDGNYNLGGNPVRYAAEMNIPIHVVPVGSPNEFPDLAIKDVQSNPIAFTGEETPIVVMIQNIGFSDTRAQVSLQNENGVVASQIAVLNSSPSEQTIRFKYKPEEPGKQRLTVRIERKEKEQALANNQRTIYIDILKSRLKIALFAGSVNPDISFLRHHLSMNDRFDVVTHIEKKGGSYYRTPAEDKMDDNDLFIWLDFPTAQTSPRLLQDIYSSVKSKHIPIILIAGVNTEFNKLMEIQELLPIKSGGKRIEERFAYLALSTAGQSHPIFQISTNSVATPSPWNGLPPILITHQGMEPWPNSEVLAFAGAAQNGSTRRGNDPLVVSHSFGSSKSLAFLGHGLWRWQLMMAGIGSQDQVYHHFVNNMVRWVQTEKSTEMVRVETDKSTYHFGDEVSITVQVYGPKYQAIDDADVSIQIISSDQSKKFLAQPEGDGRYQSMFYPETSGDYRVKVRAQQNNNPIGIADGMFSVGEYSMELSDLAMQDELLRGLADISGGRYITPESARENLHALEGIAKKYQTTNEAEIWNHTYTLIILILVLTTEWFLRKRKGMV